MNGMTHKAQSWGVVQAQKGRSREEDDKREQRDGSQAEEGRGKEG